MTTLVTGGTGFLGRHLVQRLVDDGQHVRVIARSPDAELAELGVEMIEGSLLNPDDVARATAGAQRVYHLAGRVERDRSRAHLMYDLHVGGTQTLLKSLANGDVEKIVVASTSGTVAISEYEDDVAADGAPTVERLAAKWPYYLSKIFAERVCDEYAARYDLPIVQLRPSLLLGPGDRRLSSTNDVYLFMAGKIPTVPQGGMSWVDARDIADAFVAAMERAEPGSKYLLSAQNCTVGEFFAQLEVITGIKAPAPTFPNSVALFGARLLSAVTRSVGKEPEVDPVSVEMGSHYWYCDWSRATRDLGFDPRPTRETLRDTVRWLRRNHPDFGRQRSSPPRGMVPDETVSFAREGWAEPESW